MNTRRDELLPLELTKCILENKSKISPAIDVKVIPPCLDEVLLINHVADDGST